MKIRLRMRAKGGRRGGEWRKWHLAENLIQQREKESGKAGQPLCGQLKELPAHEEEQLPDQRRAKGREASHPLQSVQRQLRGIWAVEEGANGVQPVEGARRRATTKA